MLKHILIPKHKKLSEQEKEKILKKFNARPEDFPKILITDPAIKHLDVKEGDMIEIERKSFTAGKTYFYRIVVKK